MKIEIWLDYACEKAFLTHKNLIEIINELNLDVELLYRSYIAINDEGPIDQKVLETILDLNPNYVASYQCNTIYAHQLSHLAKKQGLSKQANILLFNERYLNNNDLSDKQVIANIANMLNIEKEAMLDVIKQKSFLDAIEQNYVNAKAKKIFNAPHIRINGRVNISGYTQKSILKTIINHEAHKMIHLDHCVDGACEKDVKNK